jgi:OHCU decarboxylase
MKSNPADFDLVAPGSLRDALALLAASPREWVPIAGGTDLMVQFAAGTLAGRKLLSIWNLRELRRIDATPEEVQIGAGSTYTDIRQNEIVAREFPLLARAASWTGGIANQNRGTIGGNIVNASPAADSLPALLAYEAELILASATGKRRVPYTNFHTGYKQMQIAPDELVRAVCLPRIYARYMSYTRKVGARNAQAISKVCVAALGKIVGGYIEDVRIALGSVAPIPIRLRETEQLLRGKHLDRALITAARRMAIAESRPIDDIRSTARYRAAVIGNLIGEFLEQVAGAPGTVLTRWNNLSSVEAEKEILSCCGSTAWARGMAARRPIANQAALLSASDETWSGTSEQDWMEAFRAHPRIGESRASDAVAARSAGWSAQEQKNVSIEAAETKAALSEGNREYEHRFGHIFIVCAAGKTGGEILEILRRRLQNDAATELREAAEQQRQITQLRLKRWVAE